MSDSFSHETAMMRCLQLATLGELAVAPNPMVGSVLVYEGRIIGEGYHKVYGGPHAEINCFDSVSAEDQPFIPRSTLYVSLEPCVHFGKTPPCTTRILTEGVARVVVGCRDPFPSVNGKGIDKLRAAGVEVIVGILETECLAQNAHFFTSCTMRRPYVTLKWAQSADGFIAGIMGKRVSVSNTASARLVHRLRARHGAILVGTNTALFDDPALTTRLWPGASPVRVLLDRQLRLPVSLKLFNGEHPTLVINAVQQKHHHNLDYVRLDFSDEQKLLSGLLAELHHRKIQSLLVEGGAQTLESFFRTGLWDQAYRITAPRLLLGHGIAAPAMPVSVYSGSELIDGDRWDSFHPSAAETLSLRPE
jgi:diaminohydroxyphosphoribosylaminopyrimidine deaminase/5-amino-6-(5-phosphoribosylamino)uracil reductase